MTGSQAELVTCLEHWSREKGRTVIGVLHDISLSLPVWYGCSRVYA
ncbi:hypothetical protein [Flavonifractor sp. An91]|nr:hypothetical protein [Flavonifractor sp. An91]